MSYLQSFPAPSTVKDPFASTEEVSKAIDCDCDSTSNEDSGASDGLFSNGIFDTCSNPDGENNLSSQIILCQQFLCYA